MDKDKRKGLKPIPENIKEHMNEEQLLKLSAISKFGWEIKYIRRPLFQDPVVVVINAEGDSIGILEEDGRLNLESSIKLRE